MADGSYFEFALQCFEKNMSVKETHLALDNAVSFGVVNMWYRHFCKEQVSALKHKLKLQKGKGERRKRSRKRKADEATCLLITQEYFKGELSVREIALKHHLSTTTVYTIAREYGQRQEVEPLKLSDSDVSKLPKKSKLPDDPEKLKEMILELHAQLKETRMERDLIIEAHELSKKAQSVDLKRLTNRQKAKMIDALTSKYSVTSLACKLEIASSTYYAQLEAMRRQDKYYDVRKAIQEEFIGANMARGYRYITQRLKMRDDIANVGEKRVRKIMAEEGLQVIYLKKKRRYNSYTGEHSKAPENLVKRTFKSDAPNKLWLTDITEFRLPDSLKKVYLSPVIDCFDGMVCAWTIGTSPNAELANKSLLGACETLEEGQHPIIHSDRGNHYRWPEWIDICERYKLTRSMSKLGCSPDNSTCEGFFGRLKK